MPYRRLPNTDKARLRAMKAAHRLGSELPPYELAFSSSTYTKLSLFINAFEEAIVRYEMAYQSQSASSADYVAATKKARYYISHFLQVTNMAITREEMKPEIREYFGLRVDDERLPSLATDQELLEWGQRIIEGEFKRKSEGRAPITNPTAALVKVHYDIFFDAQARQRVLQQNTARAQAKLNDLRADADAIIRAIWNEVEAYYEEHADSREEMRANAEKYGVVYVYRPTEEQPDNS